MIPRAVALRNYGDSLLFHCLYREGNRLTVPLGAQQALPLCPMIEASMATPTSDLSDELILSLYHAKLAKGGNGDCKGAASV